MKTKNNNRNGMKRTLIILGMILLLPCSALAQWSFDVPSIEAYIADHKDQRSLLLARSALEHTGSCQRA